MSLGAPLPYCRSMVAPGSGDIGAGCCRDADCATGQCLGYPNAMPGGRRCTGVVYEAENAGSCGDETDCQPAAGLICDLLADAGTCRSTIASTLGGICEAGPANADFSRACGFRQEDGGAPLYYCALPGSLSSTGGPTAPCCYDRLMDGGLSSCLVTGSCFCDDAGACGATLPAYVCPF